MPKISIILPVYNAGRYLTECLDSVLSQTFADWELVAVDDGSKDVSGEILDKYAAKDSRIRVLHKANAGVWAARNDALRCAGGKWITFLDADDVYSTCWLESAMAVADLEDPDAILQDRIVGNDVPDDFFGTIVSSGVKTYDGVAARKWYWQTMSRNGFLWIWFIKREVIGETQFRPVINCKEDIIWLLEIASGIGRVSENEYKGYFYRIAEGSLSKKTRSVMQCQKFLSALYDIWQHQSKLRTNVDILDVIANQIRNCADHDVINWIGMRKKDDTCDHCLIRKTYLALESCGALRGEWQQQPRYRLAFWIWKRTGWLFPLTSVNLMFFALRKVFLTFRKRTMIARMYV